MYYQSNLSFLTSTSAVYDAPSYEKKKRANTAMSKQQHSMVTPEKISDRWQTGLKQASNTLPASTQHYVRSALLPLSRRYRVDRPFYRLQLNHDFAGDLYMRRIKSTQGNTCAFILLTKQALQWCTHRQAKQCAKHRNHCVCLA